MKLLIITQKIDLDDDLLGFMHGWIAELAKSCENIIVICLYKGKYELPENVKVLSLGKESGASNIKYFINFYKYIWRERAYYDKVFVHMNKEYVILGSLFWKLTRKKVVLWYNHLKGNIFSILSGMLADTVCYTSPFSFFSKNKKAKIMPAGIDTDVFKKKENIKKEKNSLFYLGRISPVKNVNILIKAAKLLEEMGADFVLNIVGKAGEKDKEYFKQVKAMAGGLEQKGKIKFLGSMPNYKTPDIYNQNEIFVNMTDSGSMDKTILEAMACECLVLVSNKSFEQIFPDVWHNLMIFGEKNEHDLAKKIKKILDLSDSEKNNIKTKSRELVVKNHSLQKLTDEIIWIIKK